MGVTGSGKTFTMANVIAEYPEADAGAVAQQDAGGTTLRANSRSSFPSNAVHYFVSYYDYYQPEAYIPQRDIYIEKDASINEEIDRLRLACDERAGQPAKTSIIVASVSCIYGLGSPDDYRADDGGPAARRHDRSRRNAAETRRRAVRAQRRLDSTRGKFRVRGDASSCGRRTRKSPAGSSSGATRSRSCRSSIPPAAKSSRSRGGDVRLSGQALRPARGTDRARPSGAIAGTRISAAELLKDQGKLLEAQRLNARTRFDIEMLMEVGYCPGIENYCRPLAGRRRFDPRHTVRFFPEDILLIVDESHATVPQIAGMFAGDSAARARWSSMASVCPAQSTTDRCV